MEEIRARERAATAKAWWWNSYSGIWCGSAKEGKEALHQIARINDIPNPEHDGDELQTEQGRSNAEFIAYAREDMSVLLTVAEAAQGVLEPYVLSNGQAVCTSCRAWLGHQQHDAKCWWPKLRDSLAALEKAVDVLEPDK